MPAKTIRAYGAVPSGGSLATLPKMTVKTIIVRNSWIRAQAMPIMVYLYRTETSRQAKTWNDYWYCQRLGQHFFSARPASRMLTIGVGKS
jgi:hypothetical protein